MPHQHRVRLVGKASKDPVELMDSKDSKVLGDQVGKSGLQDLVENKASQDCKVLEDQLEKPDLQDLLENKATLDKKVIKAAKVLEVNLAFEETPASKDPLAHKEKLVYPLVAPFVQISWWDSTLKAATLEAATGYRIHCCVVCDAL